MSAMQGMQFQLGRPAPARRRPPDSPMRLLVLGDLAGASAAAQAPLAQRRIHRVDVDNLDRRVAEYAPAVLLNQETVPFARLEDFDADRLYERMAVFADLRATREHPPADEQDLMARLLGAPSARPRATQPSVPADPIEAFIARVVAPHIRQADPERLKLHRTAVDLVIAERMRLVLHSPAFQALEAAWRGLEWMVANLELDQQLQLHVLHLGSEELADAVGGPDATASALLSRLAAPVDGQDDEAGWSALLVLEGFDDGESDLGVVAGLAKLGAALGIPVLAGAQPGLCQAALQGRQDWQALRQSPAARWLGLAAHRLLLRQPYGARRQPTERFAFEELTDPDDLSGFLWGSPVLALGVLLGQAFLESGWDMVPGQVRELEELPAVVLGQGDQSRLLPCAERALSEPEFTALLDGGLIPLVSHRNRACISVPRFQSCAHPLQALAGFLA